MTLFDLPAGKRVSITTGTVNVEIPSLNASGVAAFNLTYEATATEQFQEFNGVRRRLFVDASIEFPSGGREIWLTNDVDDEPHVEWPSELSEAQ